ncbi:hypothetical protein [Kocuria salsicia]|uniref:hypothetical protein n=1 Tax=Kocuria salsicia TaxID=664639 RepID=UPI001643CF41|nr:hypothetical protein [Kocuria salsicia]
MTETRWRPGKSRRRSHRSQRSSASGHTQLWLSIVEVLGASRGKSPLIIEDLDVYPQLPRTTGAPTLNSEEPAIGVGTTPDSVDLTNSPLKGGPETGVMEEPPGSSVWKRPVRDRDTTSCPLIVSELKFE